MGAPQAWGGKAATRSSVMAEVTTVLLKPCNQDHHHRLSTIRAPRSLTSRHILTFIVETEVILALLVCFYRFWEENLLLIIMQL